MFKGINKITSKYPKVLHNMISNLQILNLSTKGFNAKLNNDSFVTGTSASYLEKMYHSWRQDPKSVHVSWDAYFSNIENGLDSSSSFQTPPTISKGFLINDLSSNGKVSSVPRGGSTIEESLKVMLLIRSFQTYGYLGAKLDPLEQFSESELKRFKVFTQLKHLDYKSYGFSDSDLDKEFVVKTEGLTGILSEAKPLKLRNIIEHLQKAYCSTIGVEFMYNHSRDLCNFIRQKMEFEWTNYQPSKDEKIKIFDNLARAVLFEEFLKNKFTTAKRFGLEGLESVVSGLKKFVDTAVEGGLEDVTLGMPHRGRLNVLANVFKKPINKILAEFQGKHDDHSDNINNYSGDVKYHLGTQCEISYPNGKKVLMDILPNPSHLECVNPVVMGKCRAKQDFSNDVEREKHISILLHGDAAFAGQGVVYESMQMSNLENYTTGGVVHVVCNNQIGFTTTPLDARSTPFCTDIGRTIEAPIIHVNADDPIAVDFVFKFAAECSRKFRNDIIIDVIGYRKHGHNELDQPMFTQPLMYQKIAKKTNVLDIYQEKLIKEGIAKEELDLIRKKINESLEQAYQEASSNKVEQKNYTPKQWENHHIKKVSAPQNTGIKIDELKRLGEKITTIPEGFTLHPQLKKHYEQRTTSIREGKGIDWATAESLAWGSLLQEGYHVRLSGQDVERGTFSHRHAVLHDQVTGKKYTPLLNVAKQPGNFQIHNSHLSEFAVLGFELGFSYYSPDSLVMWEAQFGDFVNGAQTIIDQFISSGESKWDISSGLTLLLPHGMDGQGPEHSSCRIERFLELMDDDYRKAPDMNLQIQGANMQVCNPSFSANYFHLLLRQLKRQFRKPLIIPAPKKLLRFKGANSNIEDFGEGLRFTKVRPEYSQEIIRNSRNVKKLLICSGQVYYDILAAREQSKRNVNLFFNF
jgi:2-oxoglutarate dehydrogenase E1 component